MKLITIFGISNTPLPDPFTWAPDWYIDKYTPSWRSFRNCHDEWVIAMTNYGGLIVLDATESVSEWDTGQQEWNFQSKRLGTWIKELMREGDEYLQADI